MFKRSIYAFAIATLPSVIAVNASAQGIAPDPNQVFIESLSYNGSGCPIDTVSSSVSDNAKSFQLVFSDYTAAVEPGMSIMESRKNCLLTVGMHVPSGWSYAIAAVDYRGYVRLDSGVEATQKSSYWFANQQVTGILQSRFTGPVDKDYFFRDSVPLQSFVWSSCNESRDLRINTQVKVSNGGNVNRRGLIATDTIEGEVTQEFALAWRRCS